MTHHELHRLLVLSLCVTIVSSFAPLPAQTPTNHRSICTSTTHAAATTLLASKASSPCTLGPVPSDQSGLTRRSMFAKSLLALSSSTILATTTVFSSPLPAHAIPTVTTDEFYTILRDSARGIDRVEFSGPQSETVTVFLGDGTTFGIRDVVESPTDPRSPLKITAACRENKVATKFVNLEAALAAAPRRKKVYANERVLAAAEKEKEKAARMLKDEEDRLAAVAAMQE